jgi:hypothetical protein
MSADLSVIIVNWNTRELLSQCLSSLFRAADDMRIEVIVVDNGSKDDSARYVAQNFPQVRLIQNDSNRGFAAANNQGLIAATGRNILFLNSDTIVHKGALKPMMDVLDNTAEVGLCSCRLLNGNGSLQPNVRHFPSFRAMLQRYTVLKYLRLFNSARATYKMRDFSYDKTIAVDQVMGAVLMLKRRVLESIGGMDENLQFYFEETDLCYRIKHAGLKIYFIPDGEITHLCGASSNRLSNYKIQAMFFKSLLYYFRKHEGRSKTFLFSCVFKPGLCLYMLCEIPVNLIGAIIFWALRLDNTKIHRKLERSRRSFLFLAKYGVSFLLY